MQPRANPRPNTGSQIADVVRPIVWAARRPGRIPAVLPDALHVVNFTGQKHRFHFAQMVRLVCKEPAQL